MTRGWPLLWLAALPLLGPAARSAEPTAVQQEFMAAMDRVRQHAPEPPDSPELTHYVIHDYLLAARLQRDLELKPGEELDSAVDTFLSAHAGQPVGRALRTAWLASLATRGRWDWFLPRSQDITNPTLVCDRLAGRLATGDTEGLAGDALGRWSLPQKQPVECDPVFAWLRQQGAVTAERAEARTRAALVAENPKLARESAADVPTDRAVPLLQWARLIEAPKLALEALAVNSSIPVEPAALEAGFLRLSRMESTAAVRVLPGLLGRPDLTPELRARLQRLAALGVAYDRDSGAIEAFRQLPVEAVDNDVQEWRARAALWAGDYETALQWIEQMPASLATQPKWQYWRARAIAALKGPKAAAPLFEAIADKRDFYGYLAADRLHRGYALNDQPLKDDVAIQKDLAQEPGLIRARELFNVSLTDEAQVEWAIALTNVTRPVKIQAAQLAAHWGWYAQSIGMLAQLGELNDVRLRYPRPYGGAIAAASKLTQLPPDWILSVMRQESLFRIDAVSSAGARGVMQMRPGTASAVARRWHLPAPKPSASTPDPDADTALGAAYLRELLDRFNGQLGPSLAAYNAGPLPVTRWLPGHAVDADIWIENIPYGETRNYVERILEHIVAFAWVRDATPPRLVSLLPQVEPTAFYAQAPQR